ncbi:hypothetical protein [Kitasatospora sp. LaBMicrA B282]|uniref:hypothetical protein n=1 Tax=Kitasatospora sp. LaBMicrA B282 TaxID=3420949 RepID=UPI003D12CE46
MKRLISLAAGAVALASLALPVPAAHADSPGCQTRMSSDAWIWHDDTMCAGDTLRSTSGLQSTRLTMQADGNLVDYYTEQDTGETAVWASNTVGCGVRAVMQQDGNFVVYAADGHACWSSGTYGDNGAWVEPSALGDIAIYQSDSASGGAVSDALRAARDAAGRDFLTAFVEAIQAAIEAIPRLEWETHTEHQRQKPITCSSGGHTIFCN